MGVSFTSQSPPAFLLSKHKISQRYDVSVRTVDRWIQRGLAFYQASPKSKILISPQDLEAFLTRKSARKPNLDSMVSDVVQELANGAENNSKKMERP